jgi:hypothetical protein
MRRHIPQIDPAGVIGVMHLRCSHLRQRRPARSATGKLRGRASCDGTSLGIRSTADSKSAWMRNGGHVTADAELRARPARADYRRGEYGALRSDTGRFAISWDVVLDRRQRPQLEFNWVESGVAIEPEKVTRRGYWTELNQEVLAYALEATVD